MKQKLITSAISAAILATASLTATAYEQDDLIIRAGIATVDPNDDSSVLSVEGLGGNVPGTGVGVDSDTQLGITATYMLTAKIGVELLAATPFEHDISAKGLGGFGVSEIGSVEHLPPTLSLQYYLADPSSIFQPYVGAGINYTLILDESLSGEIKTQLGATDIELDDSIGLSLQAGFDYSLGENWLVNASIWYIDIETDAEIDSAVGKIEVDVDIDPWVYMFSVGYKF